MCRSFLYGFLAVFLIFCSWTILAFILALHKILLLFPQISPKGNMSNGLSFRRAVFYMNTYGLFFTKHGSGSSLENVLLSPVFSDFLNSSRVVFLHWFSILYLWGESSVGQTKARVDEPKYFPQCWKLDCKL